MKSSLAQASIALRVSFPVVLKIYKFAINRKNDAFVAKIVKTRLTEIFIAIFALAERLPISATPVTGQMLSKFRVGKSRKWAPPHYVLKSESDEIVKNKTKFRRIKW